MTVRGRGVVGRDRDLAELEAHLPSAPQGRGDLVLVTGEAGIGKTRLCQEAAERARAVGIDVAWAACWESGSVPAFWPWVQLLGQLGVGLRTGAGLGAGATGLGAEEGALARARLFEDVVAQLREAAAAGPRLLVVDDLHWADAPSVRLLAYLAPALQTIPVSIVATFREAEAGPGTVVGAVRGDLARHARHISLGGLGQRDMADLMESLVGSEPPPGAAEALARVTGGSPLFARELVRLLEAQGSLDRLGAGGQGVLPVPESLRAVLTGRLARLSGDCRATLLVGASVGDEFGLEVIEEATGTSRAALLDHVDEAIAARVVGRLDNGRYAFGHALLRAAVYDELGIARRSRLHQRVGEALERLAVRGFDVGADALAHHFAQAAAGGGAAKAVGYALEAGRGAMAALAYEDAARLFGQALVALDLDPPAGDRVATLMAKAEAHAAGGELAAARRAYLDAATLARAQGRPDDLAHAALGLSGGGFEVSLFDGTQVALLREALAALGPAAGPAADGAAGGAGQVLRALTLSRLSVALSLQAPVADRLALAEEAVQAARDADDARALASALAAHCDAIAGPADVERRQVEAEEIVRLAEQLGHRPAELLGRRLRMVALLEQGDMVRADAESASFARAAGALRQPLYDWYVPLWRGMRALMEGRVADCERHLAEVERIGSRAQSENALMLGYTLRWYLGVETGRTEETYETMARTIGDRLGALGTWAHVALALGAGQTGRLTEAGTRFDAVWPQAMPATVVDSEWLPMMTQVAELVSILGGHPAASWAYEQLLPHRSRFAVEGIGAVCSGSLERSLGLLAAAMGRRDEAEAHFEAALDANRGLGGALLVARTLGDAGRALGDRGRLREAAVIYRELGLAGRATELDTPGTAGSIPAPAPAPAGVPAGEAVLRRSGELWTAAWEGRTVHLKDAKGLHDLARLLARPGREIAALDLAAGPGGGRAGPRGRDQDASFAGVEGDLGDVIDGRARAAYRARLAELEEELDEADAAGDQGRSARARAEQDALLAELTAAYGLGGRPRKAGDPAERARSAVTWRIRDTIGRIEAVHPALGRHLRQAVRTGTFCSYSPLTPVSWKVAPGNVVGPDLTP